MGFEETITRRRVLRTVPVAGGIAVAGCAEETDEASGNGTDTDGNETDEERTETESETTVEEDDPPDLPNVETQIIQRDEAAITNVRHVVDGTVSWPSPRWVDVVDSALLGVWETSGNEVEFADDRTFDGEGPESSYSGAYATRDGYLYLEYESGQSQEFRYEIRSSRSPATLELYEDGDHVVTYERTAVGSDQRGPVEAIDSLIAVPEENPTTERETVRSGGVGSGFIVSPDGYVVTNAHVVGTHRDPRESVYERFEEQHRLGIRQGVSENWNLTEDQLADATEILHGELMGYYDEYGNLGDVSESVFVRNGRASTGDDPEVESWSATVETEGTVYRESDGTWGRDIAVLSVDGENLPTVTLGSAGDVETGESLYVIGYPDIGIDEFFEGQETVLEPTMTSGIVSSRRTLDTGIDSIQTDAAINSGNSGGPMYNSDGEVVGVATFSPPNVDIEGVQFGLPIDIATGFLNTLGIENTAGEMQTTYEEGLEAYWRGDCETATTEMETVLDLYPDHPQAGEFITDCETGTAPGQDS